MLSTFNCMSFYHYASFSRGYTVNLFSPNGLGLAPSTFKVVGNGYVLKNGIGYWLRNPLNLTDYSLNLSVYDYFNGLVYNDVIVMGNSINYSESFDIIIPVYECFFSFNSSENGYFEIWRDDLADYMIRVPTLNIDSIPFTLLGNHEYTFKYYVSDALVQTKTVTINESRYLEFGYWTIQTSVTPTTTAKINYTAMIFVISLYAIIIVLAALPTSVKSQTRRYDKF